MQDEILKHTKKVFKEIKNSKHTFSEKVKEILIEIFIIVFAVTLSIWLHSWSEHNHEQKIAKSFLEGLKNDLKDDIQQLNANKEIIEGLDSNYNFILSIPKNEVIDSLKEKEISKRMKFLMSLTHSNNGRYEGFKSSGKIENIENDSLKQQILKFYQQTIPKLNTTEDYINSEQLKILDLVLDKEEKVKWSEFVRTQKIRSKFNLVDYNFKVTINQYYLAIKQAEKIISEID